MDTHFKKLCARKLCSITFFFIPSFVDVKFSRKNDTTEIFIKSSFFYTCFNLISEQIQKRYYSARGTRISFLKIVELKGIWLSGKKGKKICLFLSGCAGFQIYIYIYFFLNIKCVQNAKRKFFRFLSRDLAISYCFHCALRI